MKQTTVLPSGLFPCGFPTNIIYALRYTPCQSHSTLRVTGIMGFARRPEF
jgi:hypothetical protein